MSTGTDLAEQTGRGEQQTIADLHIEDLGQPLSEVTFVVVDLETTGGAAEDGITEIGAVKVRAGEVLGEFHTLVDPGRPIPPLIVSLTGLTTAMVMSAPRIAQVLPSFLEFIRGAVLVAHNAPFDVGFLKRACAATEQVWPRPQVVDTAKLARALVDGDEARNHRLSTLAQLFKAQTTPDHRALHDARATVDVLHALIGRLGSLGVQHLPDLLAYSAQVTPAIRAKRTLADALPTGPGVYLFIGDREEVLYVGTSVNLRTRVRSYFTAAEPRRRMREMVNLAVRVDAVECATVVEAQVRELRLIAQHAPRYNRRSRRPERWPWVKLTVEPYPRLSVVREIRDDGATYLGPFGSAGRAQEAVEALQASYPVRRCTARLSSVPAQGASACILAEIGGCGAPCVGGVDVAGYAEVVGDVRRAMSEDATRVESVLSDAMARYAATERFEDAARARDRYTSFVVGAARTQRLAPLATSPEIVAARGRTRGGWELLLVRHGRLAGSSSVPAGADPMPYVDALVATGERVRAAPFPATAATYEESEIVLRWLESPGVRLVTLNGAWHSPTRGASRLLGQTPDLGRITQPDRTTETDRIQQPDCTAQTDTAACSARAARLVT